MYFEKFLWRNVWSNYKYMCVCVCVKNTYIRYKFQPLPLLNSYILFPQNHILLTVPKSPS